MRRDIVSMGAAELPNDVGNVVIVFDMQWRLAQVRNHCRSARHGASSNIKKLFDNVPTRRQPVGLSTRKAHAP